MKLPIDTYFTALQSSTQSNAIIDKLPFRVIGQNIWLYRSTSSIETEIVGPITMKEQEELIDIFIEKKCEIIVIDGSIDRKSICLCDKVSEIALVVGAAHGTLSEIIEQTEQLVLLTRFAKYRLEKYETITYKTTKQDKVCRTKLSSIYSNESYLDDLLQKEIEWIYFPGALTDTSFQKLKSSLFKYKGKVIFEHPINVNIKTADLKALTDKIQLYSRQDFPIKMIAVNSYSPIEKHIDADKIRNKMKEIFINIPVIDVCEVVM